MIKVNLQWVTDKVGGRLLNAQGLDTTSRSADSSAQQEITAVTTDSRNVPENSLFIALTGPNFDGHRFAEQALADGAVALIVQQQLDVAAPQILVEDTRHALGLLGAAVKAQVNPKTIAITGSSGKTSVKEMAAAILKEQGEVLATLGNFNNDIGVPLTLLRLEPQHKYAVIEMGANHRGEIGYTTVLAKPDVALINNVSPAHVEGFGDICAIARAKTEIFKGLSEKGIAITNGNNEFHDFWLSELKDRQHRIFALGDSANRELADLWAENIHMNNHGFAAFTLCTRHDSAKVQLPVPGQHNVSNALAAASACLALDVPLAQIVIGLESIQGVPGRMQVIEPAPGTRVIDDTYNANVASAKAALDYLGSLEGHRIMVLGDMGELGANARGYHEEVGEHALTVKINELFTLGVLSQSASEIFNGHGGRHFENRELLVKALLDAVQKHKNITVLVKGSRSAHMENVVKELIEQLPGISGRGSAIC